jgi:DNA-binding transcriptional LysR family regulator
MDRLHEMTVFVTVAEEESFSAAARRLGMSPPAVTRAITALEERLGVKLLDRSTRIVRTTDAGRQFLEDARRVIEDIDTAEQTATGIDAEPRGQLTVTAPALFGRLFVMPCIVEYLQRYPAMAISAYFLDRVVNLLEEGLDVGVRIGELPDSGMHALGVGAVRRVVCAAPRYLERQGLPATPTDLAEHVIIATSAVSPTTEWRFGRSPRSTAVRVKPRLTVNTNDAAVEAALQGLGITRVLSYQIATQLASGQLHIILAEHEPAPMPIHILHRAGRRASAKVRTFVDLVAERLQGAPALQR